MTLEKINKLKNKVTGNDSISSSELIVDLVRELGCLPEILGREYEVYDSSGKIIFRIKQKPMKLVQLNELLKVLHKLRLREDKKIRKGKKK